MPPGVCDSLSSFIVSHRHQDRRCHDTGLTQLVSNGRGSKQCYPSGHRDLLIKNLNLLDAACMDRWANHHRCITHRKYREAKAV